MSLIPPRISLDQWLAFKTVVDLGSYALAAEALNKSQSSISYLVARLNEQLPRPALRLQGRKAILTAEGNVLYRYAEQLLQLARTTEDVAQALVVDFEAEVTVALDALLQVSDICCALENFSRKFPHTRVRVLETSLSGTIEALLEKRANLVIGSKIPLGHSGRPLRSVDMIPVAAASHPLIKRDGLVSAVELRSHRQIVLRDTGSKRQVDVGWLEAEQRWTISHFSSSISLVRAGLGFAFLPRSWILDDLETGQLQQIPLADLHDRKAALFLMLSAPDTAGPATRALAELLHADLQ